MLQLEERLVKELGESDFEGPVIIQSFEEDSLRRMKELKGGEWKLVKLMTKDDVDQRIKDGTLGDYLDGLVKLGCSGIGPWKGSIIPDPKSPPESSEIIEAAHERGLFVHAYTFRSDVLHLSPVYGGNASLEFFRFFELGIDGVFADFPGHAAVSAQSLSIKFACFSLSHTAHATVSV